MITVGMESARDSRHSRRPCRHGLQARRDSDIPQHVADQWLGSGWAVEAEAPGVVTTGCRSNVALPTSKDLATATAIRDAHRTLRRQSQAQSQALSSVGRYNQESRPEGRISRGRSSEAEMEGGS